MADIIEEVFGPYEISELVTAEIHLGEYRNPTTGRTQWVACYDDENDHRHGHGPNAMMALADLISEDGR